MSRTMKWFWIIAAIAVVTRLAFFGWFWFNDRGGFYVDDSPGYLQIAQNLIDGHGFSRYPSSPFLPESFRTPGYPAFLMTVKTVTGSFYPALVLQIGMAVVIAWFLVRIARNIGRERDGVIAASIFLFMPFSILVNEQFLTQTLFTTLIMGAAYSFTLFATKGRWWAIAATAVLLPLAAYVRPIGGYLYSLFVLILACGWIQGKVSRRQALIGAVTLVVAFFVILAPWLARNERVFGRAELSSITPAFLYFYEAPAVYKIAHNISLHDATVQLDYDLEKKIGTPLNAEEYTNFSPISDILTHEALRVIFADPRAFFISRIELTFNFFVRDGIRYVFEAFRAPENYLSITVYRVPMIAERAVLLLFFFGFVCFGLARLIRFKETPPADWVLILTVLYFAALTGSMASAGLRYPAEPLFLLTGTMGLFEAYRFLRKSANVVDNVRSA